jgi:prolyl oligopeptidase PreP (S9A serine peptidase family)
VNADFVEELVDLERVDEGRFWKQKRAYEKRWRDPDDVYIDVEQREEERKKSGLPPRIGIVPYSAVADEEKRIEEEQEQKKLRPKKRSKPTLKAKSAAQGKRHD